MKMILNRYRNKNADFDKLDITLLKGIYKRDPYEQASEASFSSSQSEISVDESNLSLKNSMHGGKSNPPPNTHF